MSWDLFICERRKRKCLKDNIINVLSKREYSNMRILYLKVELINSGFYKFRILILKFIFTELIIVSLWFISGNY